MTVQLDGKRLVGDQPEPISYSRECDQALELMVSVGTPAAHGEREIDLGWSRFRIRHERRSACAKTSANR